MQFPGPAPPQIASRLDRGEVSVIVSRVEVAKPMAIATTEGDERNFGASA